MKSICVFCGSSLGKDPAYVEAARETGRILGEKGIRLVYGGANVGLMGTVANACMKAGGEAVGIIPEKLLEYEVSHPKLTELIVVKDMHERKAKMAELSQAFVSLPGGIGTMEETFEMFTWFQLGIQKKPVGILNIKGFYDPLSALLEKMIENDYLSRIHVDMLVMEADPAVLIDRILHTEIKTVSKWYKRDKNLAN